jgi:hypothetical protein
MDVNKLVTQLRNTSTAVPINESNLGIPKISSPKFETVIRNSKVVNKSYYYETDAGQIWTGPVHQMPNGQFMTGEEHSANDQNLNKIEVNTSKVQDFRQVDRTKKKVVDFTGFDNLISGIPDAKRIREANVQIKTDQKAFSNLFLSRDSANNILSTFFVDFPLLIQKNSDFPILWTSEVGELLSAGALNKSYIHSIEIKTIRLDGSPEAKSPVRYTSNDLNREPIKFVEDNGTVEEQITIGYGYDYGKQNDSFNNIYAGNVYLPNLLGDEAAGEIKDTTYMYAIRDTVSSRKTDRYFQYKVVIKYKDGAVDFLEQEVLRELEIIKKDLEEYLHEASKLGTSIVKNPFADPHIDPPEEGKDEAGRPIRSQNGAPTPGNFNIVSNRFTQDFINFIGQDQSNPKYMKYVSETSAYLTAYYSYIVDVLASETSLAAATILQRQQQYIDTFFQYLDPNTGTISSINAVISICENLIASIESAIKLVRDPRIDQGSINNASGKAYMGQKPNTDGIVTVEYTFPDIIDTTPKTDTGIDILDPQITLPNVVRQVNGTEFNRLFDKEISKIYNPQEFFKLYNGSEYGDQENVYTYFTPNTSYYYGSNLSLDLVIDAERFRQVDTGTKRSRGNRLHFPNNSSWLCQEYGLYAVGDSEPSLPFKQPGPPIFIGNKTELAKWQDATKYTDNKISSLPDSFTLSANKDFPAYRNDFNENTVMQLMSPPIDYSTYSPNDLTINYNQITPGTQPTVAALNREKFLALPPQLKGLVLYKNNINIPTSVAGQSIFNQNILPVLNSDGPRDNLYYAIFNFRFSKIYEIEYLAGFGKYSNNRLIYNLTENWRTITTSVINRARSQGKTLFCRFKEYNNNELGVSNNISEQMPLVQRYFYFTPDGSELQEPPGAANFRWLNSLPDPRNTSPEAQQEQFERERQARQARQDSQELNQQTSEANRRRRGQISGVSQDT